MEERPFDELLFEQPQTQKPLSDEELMALAMENKEKAMAQQKKREMKGCGCCPVDPPENAQRCSIKNDLRKDFDFCNSWLHFVTLFLRRKKARGFPPAQSWIS